MRQKTYLSRVKRNSDLKLEASAIEGSMTKATHVTSYIFGAPKPYKTASYIIILSLIAGILINFDVSYTFDNFLYSSGFINALILGLIIIALPALISGLITTPLAEILGGVPQTLLSSRVHVVYYFNYSNITWQDFEGIFRF